MNAATERPAGGSSTLSDAAREYLLVLADDEHVIGARHTAWIGLGPFLEEDLAFCSIAQDELGHAIALYTILTGDEAAVDRLALARDHGDYRSSALCEMPCDDWASAVIRHWLYDRAEELRWDNLADSTVAPAAALVPGVRREEAFHLRHAEQLLVRVFGSGSPELVAALAELWPVAGSLFVPPLLEDVALAEGVAARAFADLRADWLASVRSDLARWGATEALAVVDGDPGVAGQDDRHLRSPHFAELHRSINEVISLDPTAVW